MKKLSFLFLLISLLCTLLLLSGCEAETTDPCAAGHTVVTDAALPAGCTETGLTEGTHCSTCHKVLKAQEKVPATGHTNGDWTTLLEPTCTAQGTRTRACTVCEQTLSVESIAPLSHDFAEWSETVKPTCTQKGEEVSTCSRCNVTQTRAVNETAHTLSAWVTDIARSCEQDGSRHRSCTVCKNVVAVEVLKATGHKTGTFTQTAAPTCTQNGEESAQCSNCKQTVTRTVEATGHTPATIWTIDIAVSCHAPGSKHRSCTKCNAVLETETIAQLTHIWGSWTVTASATCTSEGLRARTCSRCMNEQTEVIPLANHTPSDWVVTLEATCAKEGARHRSCTACGVLTELETIPTKAHSFGEYDRTVEPGCTTLGKEVATCTACQTTDERDVAELAHSPSEWTTDTAATCAAPGSKHQTCTRCKAVIATEDITQLTHAWNNGEITREASCTSLGLTTYTCQSCGMTRHESTAALGHAPSQNWVIDTPATCTAPGQSHQLCTRCEAVIAFETLPLIDHQYGDWITLTPSTCSTMGTAARTCTVCLGGEKQTLELLACKQSDLIVDIPATCESNGSSHTECTECHKILSTAVTPKKNHAWDAWTVTTPATCTTTGTKTQKCANCSDSQTQTIPTTSHTASGWLTKVAATCTGEGSRYKSCTSCACVLEIEAVSALGHSYGDWSVTTASTCTVQGIQSRTCTACKMSESKYLPLAAHKSLWRTTLAATCFAEGIKQHTCKVCDVVVEVGKIAKSKHTPGDTWTILTLPTATKNGESALCCTVCNAPTETKATTLNGDVVVLDKSCTTASLSGYKLVYPAGKDNTTYFYSHVTELAAALKSVCGATFNPVDDSNSATIDDSNSDTVDDSNSDTYEILVGLTAREESRNAHAALQGHGYIIRVDGNKIVIVGSDDTMTMTGVQYFIRTYLTTSASTLTMSEESCALNLNTLPLANSNGSNFVYVLDDGVDSDPLQMYVSDSYNNPGYSGDGRDNPAYWLEALISRISYLSNVAVGNMITITDADQSYVGGYEVLFGEIDRVESRAFRNELDILEYGFYITGNKIVIAAHADATLEKAKDAFLAFYEYVVSHNGGILPQGYRYVAKMTDTNWITNFPQPEGVVIEAAQSNNDDSLQIVYTGNNASVSGYLAYCQKLEKAGYTAVITNDNAGDKGSYFRVYQNNATAHVLYVAYNAFSAQEDYAENFAAEENAGTKYGDFIHYYTPNNYNVYYPMHTYKECIRVVSAPLAQAYLPDATLLTQQSYTKITNSSITSTRLIGNSVGMCYILLLEDGRFVIVDGGNNVAENKDKEILHATLTELHTRATGSAPSASNPIHIAAWLVTHSHSDHYNNMNSFLSTYVSKGYIKMDYLIGNYPELSTVYAVTSGSDNTNMGTNKIPTFQGYFTSAGLTPFQYVKVHTGMTLYFANLKMEILMTYEDHAPFRITNSNDTNTVTKWTIASTDAASGTISASTVTNDKSKTTWTMLGDSCIYASRWLCAMWGGNYNSSTQLYDNGYMAADMVQLAHHGNIGCEIALYKTVQPTVVFFPHNSNSYNDYTQNGTDTWQRTVDSYVVKNLESVKYIVVNGVNISTADNPKYTDSITISFNASGINFPSSNPAWGIKYDKSTGAVTTENIGYNSISWLESFVRHQTYCKNSPIIKK